MAKVDEIIVIIGPIDERAAPAGLAEGLQVADEDEISFELARQFEEALHALRPSGEIEDLRAIRHPVFVALPQFLVARLGFLGQLHFDCHWPFFVHDPKVRHYEPPALGLGLVVYACHLPVSLGPHVQPKQLVDHEPYRVDRQLMGQQVL